MSSSLFHGSSLVSKVFKKFVSEFGVHHVKAQYVQSKYQELIAFLLSSQQKIAEPDSCAVKGTVLRRSSLRVAGSNPAGEMDVCCERYVLPGGGLCDGLIILPEQANRVW